MDVGGIRWSEDQLAAYEGRHAGCLGPESQPRKAAGSKYRNTKTVVDGITFDSKLEARYYEQLKLRKAAGEVKWFLRQVTFELEGRVRYRADFLVVLTAGGTDVIDCKGFDTRSSINKRKQVLERYGVEVQLVRSV